MKQFLFAIACLATGVLYGAVPGLHDTLEKKFMHVFPKAEKVKWYKSDVMDEVVFVHERIDCRMWFTHDGVITKTIRYYTEEHLAPFIIARIKRKYPGKNIFGVTEVTSADGLTYHIILEDEKFWLNIQSDPTGNTTVASRIKKALN